MVTVRNPVTDTRRRIAALRRNREVVKIARREGVVGRGIAPDQLQVGVRRTLESAGGIFVKLGQVASTRSDVLPPAWCDELSLLCSAPPSHSLLTWSGRDKAKGIILAKHLLLIDRLDRENLSVEIHQKVTNRTAVITDTSTGHEYGLEGKRILFHHMSAILDALAADIADDAEHETAVAID